MLIDVALQHAYFCEFRTLVRDSPVTTGASARGRGTPLGVFRV